MQMNRFFYGDELVIDLEDVSYVGVESAVIGGVLLKFNERICFDLRRQFRAFKESRDEKKQEFYKTMLSRLYNVSWAAGLFGARLHHNGVLLAGRHQKEIEKRGIENGKAA